MFNRALAALAACSLVSLPAFADNSNVHGASPVSSGHSSSSHSSSHASSSKSKSPVETSQRSPLGRPPKVVTHNHGAVHFWAEPTVFLPVFVWVPVVVVVPSSNNLAWSSGQNFFPENSWTESVYEVPPGGSQLLMTFDAPLQFDFIEVTYQDGTAATVDLSGPPRAPGTYSVVDLDPSRTVDHIRVVAQATDSVAQLTLEAQ